MSPLLLALVLVALVACIARLARSRPPCFPPGPYRLPFWGNLWQVLARNYYHPHKALKKMADANGSPVLGLMLASFPVVVANDYESVRDMFEKPEFQGRPDSFLIRLRADNHLQGIFFTDGDFWIQQRRFALRHMRDFGFGRRMERHENVVLEEVQGVVNALRDQCKGLEGGMVRMPDVFYMGMVNSLMDILFGSRVPTEDKERVADVARAVLEFQRAGSALGAAVDLTPWLRFLWPKGSGYLDFKRGNEILKDFMKDIIRDQSASFDEEVIRGFMDLYLSEMKKCGQESTFTECQMLLLLMDFMFPTASAVPTALAFAVLHMIRHPDKADRAHQEISAVVGEGRLPDLNDRSELPYTEAFLREVLRLSGTPLAVSHRATEDCWFRGYFIPKDTVLVPNLWAAHHDPAVFEHPDDFMPERFLHPVTGKLLRKDFTVSFGLGKRLCAGETFARQALFLFLAAMLQNFSFSMPPGTRVPHQEDMLFGFIMTTKQFWAGVSERPARVP